MRNLLWLTVSLFVITSQAIAAEQADKETDKKSVWNGEAELGFVKTTGNTETESFVLKAKAIHQRNKWKNTARGEALRNADGDIVTAEKYFLSGKSEYTL